jgi:hypothetical protein
MATPSTGDRLPQRLKALSQSLPQWQQETAKARFLDSLYDLYNRDDAPSGLHGTYTGLWKRYQHDLASLERLSAYLKK